MNKRLLAVPKNVRSHISSCMHWITAFLYGNYPQLTVVLLRDFYFILFFSPIFTYFSSFSCPYIGLGRITILDVQHVRREEQVRTRPLSLSRCVHLFCFFPHIIRDDTGARRSRVLCRPAASCDVRRINATRGTKQVKHLGGRGVGAIFLARSRGVLLGA